MSGSKESAQRTKATLLARDPDYYSKLGKKGGKAVHTAPFGFQTMDKDKLTEVSLRGGENSRKKREK